jgi:hypothetical protein
MGSSFFLDSVVNTGKQHEKQAKGKEAPINEWRLYYRCADKGQVREAQSQNAY